MAIFDRVARTDGPAWGLFSADAAAAFSEAIGLPQCNSFQKPRRVSKQSSSQTL